MKQTIHKSLAAAGLLLFGMVGTTATAAASDSWSFRVYLDDKPIGFHDFELDGAEGQYTLATRASFDVKILFINAFRYRHENVETWRDGCLTGISATTDNNGESLRVEGELTNDSFVVEAGDGRQTLPDCIKTFAYWNPEILTADQLLNSQTGKFEDVDIVFEERELFSVDGEEIESDRYALTTEGKTIRLWYATQDQRWLALEAPARGDRKIRYLPVDLLPVESSTRLAAAD